MTSTTFFLSLIVTCAMSTLAYGLFRGDCTRQGVFEKVANDRVLVDHVITSHDVTSDLDCARYCLRTIGCKSYNYQETGSPLHECELSNQRKTSKLSDYVIKEGFSYHEAEEVVPECSSFLCQNGGTCSLVDCGGSFECSCKPGYIGQRCETWFGFNGSTPNLPARSCLDIKLVFGQDTGDGRYWIDPADTGNPFTVYCNMTTGEARVIVCEHKRVSLSCPNGQVLHIRWALYGRTSNDVCVTSRSMKVCGNEASSLARVKQSCEGQKSCSFMSKNTDFGGEDPCPTIFKYTEVRYECRTP